MTLSDFEWPYLGYNEPSHYSCDWGVRSPSNEAGTTVKQDIHNGTDISRPGAVGGQYWRRVFAGCVRLGDGCEGRRAQGTWSGWTAVTLAHAASAPGEVLSD
jgi:hypothetical protein